MVAIPFVDGWRHYYQWPRRGLERLGVNTKPNWCASVDSSRRPRIPSGAEDYAAIFSIRLVVHLFAGPSRAGQTTAIRPQTERYEKNACRPRRQGNECHGVMNLHGVLKDVIRDPTNGKGPQARGADGKSNSTDENRPHGAVREATGLQPVDRCLTVH